MLKKEQHLRFNMGNKLWSMRFIQEYNPKNMLHDDIILFKHKGVRKPIQEASHVKVTREGDT